MSEVALVATQSMAPTVNDEDKSETAGQDVASSSFKTGATASQVREMSASAHDQLTATSAELQMHEFAESLDKSIGDQVEVHKMNKNMVAEMDSGFRHEGYGIKNMCFEVLSMNEEINSML